MPSTLLSAKSKCFLSTRSSLPKNADADAIFIVTDQPEIDLSETLSARIYIRVKATYISGPQIFFLMLKPPTTLRNDSLVNATNDRWKVCLDLSDSIQFVTLLRYSGSNGEEYDEFYTTFGHFNAERILSACNDLAWLMSSQHQPQWCLEEESSHLFTDEFHRRMDKSREERIDAYFASGRYKKAKDAAFLIRSLEHISVGSEHAALFEEWACTVVNFLFETGLRAVTLEPNKQSAERRDVVGENFGGTYFWRHALNEHAVRIARFEIRNYSEIGEGECERIGDSISQPGYGNLEFVIYRPKLAKPSENSLKQITQTYNNGSKIQALIMLSTKTICRMLLKIEEGYPSVVDYAMWELMSKKLLRVV